MMAASLRIGLGALFAVLVCVAPAHAQLYKWTDANGRVQYSDRKPPDGKQAVEVRNTVSAIGSQQLGAGNAAGSKSLGEAEKDFQKRREEQAEAQQKQQKTAQEQKFNSQNCESARRNLAALQSGQRIATYGKDGERSYMSDADRPREIERNRQIVEATCK